MNCEQISDLLPAYALDALDRDDQLAVREHLASCRRHDRELADFQTVTSSLPLAADERESPAHLRSRLLAAFDTEVSAQTAPGGAGVSSTGERKVVPLVRRPAFGWLAAAALFVAVIGLSVWNVVLQTDDGGEGGWTVSADLTGEGVDGHFWYLDRNQLAVVSIDSMPSPGPARVYQAWGIYDGAPVSLGVLPDEETVAMKADLEGASTFAITEEPAGGSDQPSGDPVATADLT